MLHHGWRSSFWVCAIIGFLAAAVWFVTARDTPAEHSRVSSSELAEIQSGVSPEDACGTVTKQRTGNADSLAQGGVQQRSAGPYSQLFLLRLRCLDFFSWFYIYLSRVRGLNLKASALYSMLPFIAMSVSCLVGGAINDRLTRSYSPRLGRCGLAVVALAIASIFIACGAYVQSARLASVILAGGAGAVYLSQSSFWSVTVDIGGTSAGSISGFMNMGNQIGAAITASLTPWIAARYGWTASFLVAAGLCVVGALSWLVIDPVRTLAPATAVEPQQVRS